ncbi:winged helix-turn-helix transcriptional regulator (plasmid) [Anaerobacillus sp. CMMVII]|uniref:ArsR/SmtB family transcription factor n=1 Tax=Anaerobacillus sp. CMMVII TaxID=2755588 RepID=UPI0021B8388D|nr:metalloregulator ArsR/SmtB family transcription factor [Anaerobacillus sp. CMMVII]MCT8139220.1 winged helix-turn-helix transcriptional regulator [Anaerobacillus sp. CMMVII]
MDPFSVEKMATVLKLLGDQTRLTMILLLKESDCCVCEFVELFNMSQPSISQHVRKLKDAGIVNEARRGQWIFYSLNKQSDYYKVILSITEYLPTQEEKIYQLEKLGKKISCD